METGLAEWIAQSFIVLAGMPLLLILLAVVTVTKALTEVTSNTATATVFMPIAAALAVTLGISPYGIMAVAAIVTSLAFMMPAATPPNAIIFGSGLVSIADMAKAGFCLNVITILLVTVFAFFLLQDLIGLRNPLCYLLHP